jgi:hypothetical protein
MKKSAVQLTKILTYSGTLPLVVSALSMYFHVNGFNTALIATIYSAIIISFLCGIHWAAYLFFADKCPCNLLITSNIIALAAWVSVSFMHSPTSTLLQAFCFLYLLTLDLKLRDTGIILEWFYALRRNATIIVVLCLAIIAGLS